MTDKASLGVKGASRTMVRINVGCGATPTLGWLNFDNSPTVRLSRHPLMLALLRHVRLIAEEQLRFASVAREAQIRWADASVRIPLADGTVGVVYTSHMLEHLDCLEARRFLTEILRVLAPGGIVRVAVPDLARLIRR